MTSKLMNLAQISKGQRVIARKVEVVIDHNLARVPDPHRSLPRLSFQRRSLLIT